MASLIPALRQISPTAVPSSPCPVVSLTVESSDGNEVAARGMTALQEFIKRPELGISGSRQSVTPGVGYKGFELGALSVFFDKAVLTPLAEMLKAFVVRNRSLSLKFPSADREVVITAENVSVDQLVQLLEAAGRFSASRG